jgi:hypothetical protein
VTKFYGESESDDGVDRTTDCFGTLPKSVQMN